MSSGGRRPASNASQGVAAGSAAEPLHSNATAVSPTGVVLFVLAVHVPDERNCGLLADTITSVVRHHPRMPILVVDNGSPDGNVPASVARAAAHAGGLGGAVRVVRRSTSHGQLGALEAAHAELARGMLGGVRLRRLVLLQHSTWLRRPLPMADATQCPLRAIGGSFPRRSPMRLAAGSTAWAGIMRVATELRLRPAPPARRTRGGELDWAGARHGLLGLSAEGWGWLSSLRLWAAVNATGGVVHAALPSVDALWASVRAGKASLREINGGWERLAGMLVARATRNAKARQPATQGGQGLLTCRVEHVVEKVHGGTLKTTAATPQTCRAKRRLSLAAHGADAGLASAARRVMTVGGLGGR